MRTIYIRATIGFSARVIIILLATSPITPPAFRAAAVFSSPNSPLSHTTSKQPLSSWQLAIDYSLRGKSPPQYTPTTLAKIHSVTNDLQSGVVGPFQHWTTTSNHATTNSTTAPSSKLPQLATKNRSVRHVLAQSPLISFS